MRVSGSATSIFALLAAGAAVPSLALAQSATVTVGAPITISPSSANVLNLLAPYLSLNSTTIGQQTLSTSLSQAILTNNGASLSLQQLGESDENLLNSPTPTKNTLRTAPVTGANAFGIAANLGGGLPNQGVPAGGTVTPSQPVGGLGAVLGGAYVTGVGQSNVGTGPLGSVVTLLNDGYNNLTSPNLGVAKNYFADGGATSTVTYAADMKTVTSATTFPAVAPAGYTLPTFNGLPNTANSVYDLAYGVNNTQSGQDVFGSSRPVQVSTAINSFDPTALNQLAGNPSFPSGHTTYAYTDSILLAMAVPQEYQSMLYRASAYANSRIVVGVHYPLDIIASRALSSYELAQAFTNPLYVNNATTTGTAFNLAADLNAAKTQIGTYLNTAARTANCGTGTVASCANSAANTANDPYAVSAAAAATYTANLTYGLPTLTFAQAPQEAAPTGGPDASILLAPVYGGNTTAALTIAPAAMAGTANGTGTNGSLTTNTINQIIVNTETNALASFYGTSLSYWTRINLPAAAGYFGNLTGTLTLDPTDVVTTNTSIASGGQLNANGGTIGTIATNVTTTVNTGGTFAPGGATTIGSTATVNGNLAFAAGSNYNVALTPTTSDRTTVTGTAALNGTVNVTPAFGVYKGITQYTILTTTGGPGTITGAFTGVNTNRTFITGSTAIVGDPTVVLTLQALPFNVVAQTSNQNNVGVGLTNGAIQPLSANGAAIIANLQSISSAAQARSTFDSLSGEGITAAQNAAHRGVSEFTSSITDQTTFYSAGQGTANSITLTGLPTGALGYAPPQRELADFPIHPRDPVAPIVSPRTWRAWATGFGGSEDIHGNNGLGSAGQTSTVFGGSLGVDYQLTPDYLAGIAVGGSDGEFQVANRATSGSTTGGHIAFYDLATFGSFYGASVNTASFFGNKTSRVVAGFGAVPGENDRGNFDSHEFRTRLEVGRHFDGYGGIVTPFIALEIADLRSNGFSETNLGGPTILGLNVQGQSSASVPSFAGARYQGLTVLGNGMTISPSLQVAYVHEFAPQRQEVGQFVSLPGSTFLVDGARPSRDAAQVKTGAELAVGPQSTLFATFDGEFSGQATFYGGKGGFKYVW